MTKITELSAASSLTGAEIVPVVQSGTTVRTTVTNLLAAATPVTPVVSDDLLKVSNTDLGLDASLRALVDGNGVDVPLQLSTSAVMLPEGVVWPYGDSTRYSGGQTGIIIPFYIYPNNPYTDPVVARLLGLIRQYRDVPVIVVINPASGPGTVWDGNYAAFIRVLRAAGACVAGYVSTAYAVKPAGEVQADINAWLTLYADTPISTCFLDEQPYDLTVGAIDTVQLYKSYTDYCHARNLAPVIGNPGTNQRGEHFAVRTSDIIVVNEVGTYPSEASMLGGFVGGHIDYKYTLRAAMVYAQATLVPGLVRQLAKYVQYVYITDDVLSPSPWDSLPTYLELLFAILAGRDRLNATTDFGVVGNGVADDRTALLAGMTAAVAAGLPLHLSPGTYLVLARINFPAGLTLIGDGQPEDIIIRYGTNSSADCARVENASNVWIENVTFDNGADLGFSFGNPIEINNSSYVTLRNIRVLHPADDSVRIHLGSHHVTLEDSVISDNTIDHGVIIDNASYVTIRRNEISRNLGFGCFVTNGSHHIFIENNTCEDNGLEAVAITYSAYIGRVIDNYIKGSGDNGISITGKKFVCVGNECRENHFHGIELFGDHNTCTGNHCWSNGQVGNPGYAGVATYPGFGGLGSYNVIVGNNTGDDQTVKTQDYAVRLYNNTYTSWTNGGVVTLSTTSIYQRHLLNIYVATTAGTMATGSEPVHTSGTVAGADTIAWKYIASTTSSIDFNSAYNFVSGNSNGGNNVSEFNLGTSTKFNTVHGTDRTRLPALSSTASFPYCEVISGTGTPEAIETGTNGSLFLRRNGTPGVTAYLMSNASAASRQTTGWKPIALRDTGAEALRPDLTGGGSGLRGYTYWNDDIDHLQVWETAAWATLKAILTEAHTGAGALDITRARNTLSNATGGTYAVTLAAPTVALLGVDKDVTMIAGDGTNTVTLALTNVVGGTGAATATFDALGETLSLRAIQTAASTYRWMVTKEYGVTLT
jgi:hypothetical protein